MREIIALAVSKQLVKRSQFIKFFGSVDTNVYFIETGCVKMSILIDDTDQIIRFGYAGDLIVALDSYITGHTSELCIQALKKSEIRVIAKSAIKEFIMKDISNMLYWQSLLESLILQQMNREIDLLISSPKERFDRVLARSPRLFQEVASRYIANYLRMKPETLSRLKKS